MKYVKASWLPTITLVAAMVFFTGCEDGIDSVGQEVLPGTDQISTFFTDSLDVVFSSQKVDSQNSYKRIRDIFGNYIDPQFGRMTANMYTAFNPSLNEEFIELPQGDIFFDSVVLKIDISSAYGRPESPQIIQVFELMDVLPDTGFVNSEAPPTKSLELSNDFQFSVDGETGEAQLSVRLNDEIGQRILFANSEVLTDNDAFQGLFPGLAISTQPVSFFSREPGAIYQVFSIGGNTELEIFYKRRDENSQAFFGESATFGITDNTKRFYTYTRDDQEGTLFQTDFVQQDSSDVYEFMQGVNLVQNFVRFPNITDLGNVLSNRAVLSLKVIPEFLGSNSRFAPPADILVYFADEDGNIAFDEDSVASLALPAPVNYSPTTESYEIFLTDYVNDLILGKIDNNGIVIQPILPNILVNRAVIGGLKNPEYAPSFEVFYINFPN